MFEHDCLDTCRFWSLICMCLLFLYLHLVSTIEHGSHGKAHYNMLIIIIIIIIINTISLLAVRIVE